jgi:hypothetical protein
MTTYLLVAWAIVAVALDHVLAARRFMPSRGVNRRCRSESMHAVTKHRGFPCRQRRPDPGRLIPVAVWLRPASSVLCGSPNLPAGARVTPGRGCGMPARPVALVTEMAGLERVTDRPEDGEAPGDVPFA